jgi:hypothetical protein
MSSALSEEIRIVYNQSLWNFALDAPMDGYRYLVQRNRLMQKLEDDLRQLEHLPEAERIAETRKLEAQFDIHLRELYTQVASEYPGERKVKARPLTDPH